MKITTQMINEVKAKGFLINRATTKFSGRIVPRGTIFTAKDFAVMSEIADKFGNGKLMATSRQCIEISGIEYENIQAAIDFASENGLSFGGTGAKVRPVTACKGTTCIYGNIDTHRIATLIHDEFYVGRNSVKLPHKIKISVGGCPNSCIKPSVNDIGIEGHKVPVFDEDKCKKCKKCVVESSCPVKAAEFVDGKLIIDNKKCIDCGVCIEKCTFDAFDRENTPPAYKIFIGGSWGKRTVKGTALSKYVTEEDILPIIEKTILWFRDNAESKERLGAAIERIGFEKFEREVVESDELLCRREEILNKEI
ncbi:MAG: 4Fe-4S binding protein [Eubacteriaceae bacterium]|nr:4Fe-4S binding protein [Eubacteriaceae bacterium]